MVPKSRHISSRTEQYHAAATGPIAAQSIRRSITKGCSTGRAAGAPSMTSPRSRASMLGPTR